MQKKIEYNRLTSEHFDQIADIQLKELPLDITSQLGKQFLVATLYPVILRNDVASLVVRCNERVVGFCFVTTQQNWILSVVGRSFLKLLNFAIKNPKRALDILLTALSSNPTKSDVELAWIAILTELQGQSIGSNLIERSIDLVRAQKYSLISVKTLQSTPQNVKFYENSGFIQSAIRRGRIYLIRKTIN